MQSNVFDFESTRTVYDEVLAYRRNQARRQRDVVPQKQQQSTLRRMARTPSLRVGVKLTTLQTSATRLGSGGHRRGGGDSRQRSRLARPWLRTNVRSSVCQRKHAGWSRTRARFEEGVTLIIERPYRARNVPSSGDGGGELSNFVCSREANVDRRAPLLPATTSTHST